MSKAGIASKRMTRLVENIIDLRQLAVGQVWLDRSTMHRHRIISLRRWSNQPCTVNLSTNIEFQWGQFEHSGFERAISSDNAEFAIGQIWEDSYGVRYTILAINNKQPLTTNSLNHEEYQWVEFQNAKMQLTHQPKFNPSIAVDGMLYALVQTIKGIDSFYVEYKTETRLLVLQSKADNKTFHVKFDIKEF